MAAVFPKSTRSILSLFGKVATTSHYEVFFSGFAGLQKLRGYITTRAPRVSNYFVSRELGLLCNRAELPGTSFATAQVEGHRMGITEKFAHTRVFTDTTLTFYVDLNYNVIKFFELWQEFIASGALTVDGVKPTEKAYYQRMQYPAEYKVQSMRIVKFDKDHYQNIEYTFINAFPVNVTSMPVSYEGTRLLECQVTFAYDRYFFGRINSLTDTPVSTPAAPGNQGYGDVNYSSGIYQQLPEGTQSLTSNYTPDTYWANTDAYSGDFGVDSSSAFN